MTEENFNFDADRIVKHWIETSEEDFQTMLKLFDSKSYGWSLFLGHMSIEKLLKAFYIRKNKRHAPFTHNLYRLAILNEIELTDEFSDWLDKITSFNQNARYNDYNREFYQLCTPDFTKDWIDKIIIIRTWLKQML